MEWVLVVDCLFEGSYRVRGTDALLGETGEDVDNAMKVWQTFDISIDLSEEC